MISDLYSFLHHSNFKTDRIRKLPVKYSNYSLRFSRELNTQRQRYICAYIILLRPKQSDGLPTHTHSLSLSFSDPEYPGIILGMGLANERGRDMYYVTPLYIGRAQWSLGMGSNFPIAMEIGRWFLALMLHSRVPYCEDIWKLQYPLSRSRDLTRSCDSISVGEYKAHGWAAGDKINNPMFLRENGHRGRFGGSYHVTTQFYSYPVMSKLQN